VKGVHTISHGLREGGVVELDDMQLKDIGEEL
jgi:hypothetical protein